MRVNSTSLQQEPYYDQQIDRDQLQIRHLVVLVLVGLLEVHLLELANHQMRLQGAMEMSHRIRILVFLAMVGLVAGCKVAVIVVEGGKVQSNGSDFCLEGTICIVEVNYTYFFETFTAVPNSGWHFVKWNSGEGFFCGGSTNPTCVLSTEGYAENPELEAIIASDQTFYIMPIFGLGPDTVTVDGREWAQVDQFTNLSWNDINAVCPAGVCSGVLNGYDMTGWTWASVDDVNALFNHYIGSDELGPGTYSYVSIDCSVVRDFRDDGFSPSAYDPYYYPHWELLGLLRERLVVDDKLTVPFAWVAVAGTMDQPNEYNNCWASVEGSGSTSADEVGGHANPWGGWFWRSL